MAYWTKQRKIGAAVIVVVGGLIIFNNVNKANKTLARSMHGQPCQRSSDCNAGICLELPGHHVCSVECVGDPATFKCPGESRCQEVIETKGASKITKHFCLN